MSIKKYINKSTYDIQCKQIGKMLTCNWWEAASEVLNFLDKDKKQQKMPV